MGCRTAPLPKALIRSLSRINKDGGIQQPPLEAGVPHSRQTDKTSAYYQICLPLQILHQETSSELRRSLALVASADAVELEEVKEELRRDTAPAGSPSEGGARTSGEVQQQPGTFLPVNQLILASILQEAAAAAGLLVPRTSDPAEAENTQKKESEFAEGIQGRLE